MGYYNQRQHYRRRHHLMIFSARQLLHGNVDAYFELHTSGASTEPYLRIGSMMTGNTAV